MATEGAALSHLKDAYYILTHNLADVPLDTLRDENQADPKSLENANLIVPVVTMLAITMMDFNTAVETVDALTSAGMTSARFLIALDILIIIVVLGILMYVLWNIVRVTVRSKRATVWVLVPTIGRVVIGALVFLAFMISWLIMVRAHRDVLGHNADILKTGYWSVHNQVGSTYAMRFEAAVQQGTVSDFVDKQSAYAAGNPHGSTLIPGPDCEDGALGPKDPRPCTQIIDACSATVPSLASIIQASCANEIHSMLDKLQTIKTEGVDMYDRAAIWKTISAGVDVIRHTVDVSADADTSQAQGSGPLDATAAQKVIDTQIAPLMNSEKLKFDTMVLITLAPADMIGQRALMAPTFDSITSEVIAVLQKLNFGLDINDYRDSLDASMALFYNAAVVCYPQIQTDMLSIIFKVQKAEDGRPPPAMASYVDPLTLIARIKDMGPSAWTNVVISTEFTRRAVRSFLAKFKLPQNQPVMGMHIIQLISVIASLIGFVFLLMYITDVFNRLYTSSMDGEKAARYIVIAACMYALGTVAISSMISRMNMRSGHNYTAMRMNGQLLASYLDATEAASVYIQNTAGFVTGDAQTYIDASIGTIRAYDACNSVTEGASVMPFPMLDVVIYLTTVIVVMASAFYGIMFLEPGQKLANIKILMRLKERVANGEVPGGMVKQLECCRPNNSVWHILYWIAVAILFLLNIYVMASVQKTNAAYQNSLNLLTTCV